MYDFASTDSTAVATWNQIIWSENYGMQKTYLVQKMTTFWEIQGERWNKMPIKSSHLWMWFVRHREGYSIPPQITSLWAP